MIPPPNTTTSPAPRSASARTSRGKCSRWAPESTDRPTASASTRTASSATCSASAGGRRRRPRSRRLSGPGRRPWPRGRARRAQAWPRRPGGAPHGRILEAWLRRPVQRTPKGTTVVLTGIAGVLGGILIFAIVANVVGSRADKADSPAATFDVGPADDRARDHRPGRTHPVPGPAQPLPRHLRPAPGGRRLAGVRGPRPRGPRRCFLEWRAATREFVDACDGRAFPADGTGLVSYPARVDEREHVVVDLRARRRRRPPADQHDHHRDRPRPRPPRPDHDDRRRRPPRAERRRGRGW